mmetsp:Transcript_20237/g.28465  ORF Transcript_20237/g.28465 Transcript_20237/m.28465 type:complete len:193 (+) Transcript_20237:90-668(+)
MGSVAGKITSETPKYTLQKETDVYEIRKYAKGVAVETIDGPNKDDNDSAFKSLAKYIGVFGEAQNQQKQKIAMTAPVVNREDGKQVRFMQFLLPSKFTIDTAPIPQSDNVKLIEVPERMLAVHRFSGVCDDAMAKGKLEVLIEALKKDKIAFDKSYWRLYRYNPPWTIGSLRTNEVVVPLVDFNSSSPAKEE